MMTHDALSDVCRAKLATLVVCTTGAIAMAATKIGYTRSAGSFVADGFAPGMELVPANFASNPIDTIKSVTASTIVMTTPRAAETSANGRTLTVRQPSRVALENEDLAPDIQHPYLEEQYIPGPSYQPTNGPHGLVILEPQYSPRIFVPRNTGKAAVTRYADAIAALFAPNTNLALPTGTSADDFRVRTDVAPFESQLQQNAKGTHAVKVVTIPLRCMTTNLI
jgi:hypothetical protein